MRNNIFLSIIIPIYNCETFLDECLNSVIKRIDSNIEVICIDDGSTDKSGEICKEYCNKNNRIRYYKIENGGVSRARNYGIKAARGEYVSFVDADDYIDATYADIFADIENKSDLIICGYTQVGSKNNVLDVITPDYIESDSVIDIILNNHNYASWNKRFSTKIILDNNIWFPENVKFGEDMRFVLEYGKYVKSYQIRKDSIYFYRLNFQSSMHNARIEYIYNHNENYIYLSSYAKKNGLISFYEKNKEMTFDVLMNTICQLLSRNVKAKDIKDAIETTVFIEEMKDVRPLKRRVQYCMLKNNWYRAILRYKSISRVIAKKISSLYKYM